MHLFTIRDNEIILSSEESPIDLDDLSTGQRIKLFRKDMGFSQKELAEKIGVTQSSIALWEKDKTTPGFNNVRALAHVLETTASTLCDEKTWLSIKAKLPSGGQETLEAAENDEYFTKMLEIIASHNEEDNKELIENHIKLLEEHSRLMGDVAYIRPIIPLYKQLNEKGQALCYALLESMTKNPRFTNQETSSPSSEEAK